MFTKTTDASKVALYYLVHYLKEYDFLMIDCQVPNAHLKSLGSKNIPRVEFIQQLKLWVDYPQDDAMWLVQKLSDSICIY